MGDEVMMGLGVEVEIGVSGLVVHFVTQRAIRSPVNTSRKGRWLSLPVSMVK
jgi:hypothetical protein